MKPPSTLHLSITSLYFYIAFSKAIRAGSQGVITFTPCFFKCNL